MVSRSAVMMSCCGEYLGDLPAFGGLVGHWCCDLRHNPFPAKFLEISRLTSKCLNDFPKLALPVLKEQPPRFRDIRKF